MSILSNLRVSLRVKWVTCARRSQRTVSFGIASLAYLTQYPLVDLLNELVYVLIDTCVYQPLDESTPIILV